MWTQNTAHIVYSGIMKSKYITLKPKIQTINKHLFHKQHETNLLAYTHFSQQQNTFRFSSKADNSLIKGTFMIDAYDK